MNKEMFRKYRLTVIMAALVTVLPALISLFISDLKLLPWLVPVLSLAYLAVFALMCLIIFLDKNQSKQQPKVIRLELWIMPIISWTTFGSSILVYKQDDSAVLSFVIAMMGVLFIVMGNYLPKVRPNHTFGVRTVWSYTSDENWNKTNRLSGKIFVIGGILMVLIAILRPEAFGWMIVLIAIMCLFPIWYSWDLYHKQLKAGEIEPMDKKQKRSIWWGLGITAALVVFVFACLFTGDVSAHLETDGLKLQATMYDTMTIPYDQIESVSMEDSFDPGSRVFGVGNFTELAGQFKNKANRVYILYGQAGADKAVVISTETGQVAVSLKDTAALDSLYEQLLEKTKDS